MQNNSADLHDAFENIKSNASLKNDSASSNMKEETIVFGYCSRCKANYSDCPQGRCLCSASEAGSRSGMPKDVVQIISKTGTPNNDESSLINGLQNPFDAKIQSLDVPGHSHLLQADAASAPEGRQSKNDVLGSVCALAGGLVESGKNTPDPVQRSATKRSEAPGDVEARKKLSLGSAICSLPRVNRTAEPEERSFDIFIVDTKGNMDTYEMSKVCEKGESKIIINKKECTMCDGNSVKTISASTHPASINESVAASITTSGTKKQCTLCSQHVQVQQKLSESMCMHGPATSSLTVTNKSGGKVSTKSTAHQSGAKSASLQRCSVVPTAGFVSTIIFDDDGSERAPDFASSPSRADLHESGKVAHLVSFYEKISRDADKK